LEAVPLDDCVHGLGTAEDAGLLRLLEEGGEHSVILTFPRDAVDDVRTPDPKYRYTWHSAALTSGCC
jgi:hypothetical protein